MCIDCTGETSGTDCTECASGWGVTTGGDCVRTSKFIINLLRFLWENHFNNIIIMNGINVCFQCRVYFPMC